MQKDNHQEDNNQVITDILNKVGLGKKSTTEPSFNPECLYNPTKMSRARNIIGNPNYEPPTPGDIATLKDMTGLTTGELCRIFCTDRRKMNAYISERNYEKGERIPHSIWATLVESASLRSRTTLKAKLADIREEVLLSKEVLPTKHELYLMQGISGKSLEEISEESGIDLEIIKVNFIRGSLIFNKENQYTHTDKKDVLSKVSTAITSLSREQWKTIKEVLDANSLSFLTLPPRIRASTLSRNTDRAFSSAKGKGDKNSGKWTDNENKLREFLDESGANRKLEDADENALAEYDYDIDTPYFIPCELIYTPPTPRELKQIVMWSGFSINELSTLMDINPSELKFLISHKAIDYQSLNKKTGKLSRPKTRHIKYYQWRRLIESINLVTPLLLPKIEGK